MVNLEKKSIEIQNHMIVLHMILIEFQITMTMAQPLYRDNKMNSQKLLKAQKMPLTMM